MEDLDKNKRFIFFKKAEHGLFVLYIGEWIIQVGDWSNRGDWYWKEWGYDGITWDYSFGIFGHAMRFQDDFIEASKKFRK